MKKKHKFNGMEKRASLGFRFEWIRQFFRDYIPASRIRETDVHNVPSVPIPETGESKT